MQSEGIGPDRIVQIVHRGTPYLGRPARCGHEVIKIDLREKKKETQVIILDSKSGEKVILSELCYGLITKTYLIKRFRNIHSNPFPFYVLCPLQFFWAISKEKF